MVKIFKLDIFCSAYGKKKLILNFLPKICIFIRVFNEVGINLINRIPNIIIGLKKYCVRASII